MEFLKTHLARLQKQFAQLTPSQKMLSIALIVIMAMTLGWWGRYAGAADMEPLLNQQDIPPENFSRIEDTLRSHGIPFTPSGSRILVPADRRYEAVAILELDQLLPKDISSAFSDFVGKMDNPLNSQERSASIRNEGKQMAIGQILRYFPNVQNAMVLLDNKQVRSFTNPINATATVSLRMKPGTKADGKLVSAAADTVTGAVAGLMRSNVQVIVDGVSRFHEGEDGIDGDSSGGAGSRIDQIREYEDHYAKQVTAHLSFCEGVMVHVAVVPKDDARETDIDQYDPKSSMSKEKQNTVDSTSSTTANRPTGDVGVNDNVGTGTNKRMDLSGGGGGGGEDGQSTKSEKTSTTNDNRFGHTHTHTRTRSGTVNVASASVMFPRSFFVRTYKSIKGTDKDPGEVVLATFIQSELERMRKVIRPCLPLLTDEALLAVDTYVDLMPTVSDAPMQATGSVATMVGAHGKEIVLGVMALASLFMVSSLVRKSGAAAVANAGSHSAVHSGAVGSTVDALIAKNGGGRTTLADDTAEVGEGGQALDGIELDDDAVRAQQVIGQVSTLIKDDPEMAAAMIKRWMNRT